MHRVTSATSVLSLDDLEDDTAKTPRFTRAQLLAGGHHRRRHVETSQGRRRAGAL